MAMLFEFKVSSKIDVFLLDGDHETFFGFVSMFDANIGVITCLLIRYPEKLTSVRNKIVKIPPTSLFCTRLHRL